MKTLGLVIFYFFLLSMVYPQIKEANNLVIAQGQMPNMTRDNGNTIQIVYGKGDSIMYISSKDGISFNVTPRDVYFGEKEQIQRRKKRIKHQNIGMRRAIYATEKLNII